MSNLPVFTVDKMVPAYCGRLKIAVHKFKLLQMNKDHSIGCFFISDTTLVTDGLRPFIGVELTMSVPINRFTSIDHRIAIYALRVVVLGIKNNLLTIRQQGHREFVINLHPRCSAMVVNNVFFSNANYVVNMDKGSIVVFEDGGLPSLGDDLSNDSSCQQVDKADLATSEDSIQPYPKSSLLEITLSSSLVAEETKTTPPINADRFNVLVATHSINNLSKVLEGMTVFEDDLSDEEIAILGTRINFIRSMLDDSIGAFNHAAAELKKNR